MRPWARKHFLVKPRPYLGQPLEECRELVVPGFEDARVELYLVVPEEERRGVVTLSCGGTAVLDDISLIDGDDAPRALWQSGQFEGVIDFPELHVAPITRKGFTHDEPVSAFTIALSRLEGELEQRLQQEQRQRAEQRRQDLARHIRRAFGSVARRLPEYELFGVRGKGESRDAGASATGRDAQKGNLAGGAASRGEPQEALSGGVALGGDALLRPASSESEKPPTQSQDMIYPPGPLDSVVIRPRKLRLPPLASRRLSALALDADLRPAEGEIAYEWHLTGPGDLMPNGERATYTAPERPPEEGAEITVALTAICGERVATAEVSVSIAGSRQGPTIATGVPEPIAVSDPAASWRSRMQGEHWEYNAAHPDCVNASATAAGRLRYLIHLFAKEIVLRNHGTPADAEVLERMVEVLTYLDEAKRGAKGGERTERRAAPQQDRAESGLDRALPSE